jgi:putative membrane protein
VSGNVAERRSVDGDLGAANQRRLEPAAQIPEIELDYQFALANEQTFLARQRAALYLLVAALAVEFVPALRIPAASGTFGVALAVAAILTAGMGLLRWKHIDQSIRRSAPLPRRPMTADAGAVLTVNCLRMLRSILRKVIKRWIAPNPRNR